MFELEEASMRAAGDFIIKVDGESGGLYVAARGAETETDVFWITQEQYQSGPYILADAIENLLKFVLEDQK